MKPSVKDAVKALRIASRNIGKDWPIVSLSVAVAFKALTGRLPPRPKARKP